MLESLEGYLGIEIFNGVIFRLEGSGLADDVWDNVLSKGRLIWGFGNDDFHRWVDLGRAFNVVLTDNLDSQGVIAAVKKGSFYVSTGLMLEDLTFENSLIKVIATHPKSGRLEYSGFFHKCRQ